MLYPIRSQNLSVIPMSEIYQRSSIQGKTVSNPGSMKASIDPASLPINNKAPTRQNVPWALPVYQTLPPNAGNFSIGQEVTLDGQGDGYLRGTREVVLSTTVPAGVVMYSTRFMINVIDTYTGSVSAGVPRRSFTAYLYANKASKPYNQGIAMLPFDDWYACTIIAGPGDLVEIAVTYDFSIAMSIPDEVKFITHLEGQMLSTNDMQPEYTALKMPMLKVE